MSLNTELIPVKKDHETIRKDVLTNIIKMFYERKHISKSLESNFESIKKYKDDDTYKITLDKALKPDSDDEKYIKNFDGNSVYIRIIHQKIQGLTKLPIVKDFLTQYKYNHKIFIFDDITDKLKSSLMLTPNTEVFTEPFFLLNLVDYIDSPKYEVLSQDEVNEILESYILKKKEMMKILTTDPVVSYFNLKRGDVLRIIRCSEQSGKSIAYRIVAKST